MKTHAIGKPAIIGTVVLALCCAAGADQGRYVVKAGDTLQKIAANQLGDSAQWKRIAEINNLRSPYAVSAGQSLVMPTVAEAQPAQASASARSTPTPGSLPLGLGNRFPSPMGTGVLIASGVALAAGVIMWLAGGILFLISAFRESFWWGIGSIFFCFPLGLIFAARYWEKARRGVVIHLVGHALVIVAAGAYFAGTVLGIISMC